MLQQQQENIRPAQPVTAHAASSPQHVVQIKEQIDPQTCSEKDAEEDVDFEQEVTNEHLQLWLRRCRRKYLQGVTVIKVANTGKLVKRQLYINAKPEYLELISSKLFDTAYHLGSVESVKCTLKSPDFDAFLELQPGCMPKAEKSLVLLVGGRYLSLVFKTLADRLDAQLYLKAWSRMTLEQGPDKLREFERRCTIPAMIALRKAGWGMKIDNSDGDNTTVVVRGTGRDVY